MQINIDEVNRQIEEEAMQRIQDCDDYSNLCADSDEDESHIEKFKKELLP